MTQNQRRALALILQVIKYEVSKPNGRYSSSSPRRVRSYATKEILANFEVKEISFKNIDMEEKTDYFKLYSESMNTGNIRLKSDRDRSDDGYNRTIVITSELTASYVTGWDENRSYFSAWVESPGVVKIEDDSPKGHRVFAYYIE